MLRNYDDPVQDTSPNANRAEFSKASPILDCARILPDNRKEKKVESVEVQWCIRVYFNPMD